MRSLDQNMNGTYTFRTATRIALPFLLLPASAWLAVNAPEPLPANIWSQGVLWSLRAIYIGGAFLGWLAGSPRWFYPWLGFAVYAAVAALLQLTIAIMSWGDSRSLSWLGIFLIPLAFSPYFAAAIWLGWQRSQRLLAAYTVFPHAGLTIPLFSLAIGEISGGDWQGTLLAAAGAAAVATVFWSTPLTQWRRGEKWEQAVLLFGGVILTQTLFLIGYTFLGNFAGSLSALLLLIPLIVLGWLILSGPLLLPPLLQRLIRLPKAGHAIDSLWQKGRSIFPSLSSVSRQARDAESFLNPVKDGERSPKGETPMSEETTAPVVPETRPRAATDLDRFYKLSVVVLAALAVIIVALYVGRAAVYKIHEFERGLHLRGGRFLGVQTPGWHAQIPLVDTVIIVKVNERLGYVESIPAMTSDNVTMDVSLQYTYRVTDPERFALAVDDPERIVFEFVQGRLRDVINTKAMAGVINQRTEMNLEIMQELKEKGDQYGVEFITVQIQNASPPAEVLAAIKDRMVASQRQEQAEAEAAQQRTAADALFYAAQKEAEADAYRITTTAAAEAEQIQLTTEAQQLAVRAILSELEGKGALAEKYIDYLIAVELKENSKWILGAGAEPILELRTPLEE